MPLNDIIAASLVLGLVVSIMASTMWSISRLSGWAALAREFPAKRPLPDADRGLGSIRIGMIWGYNNCVIWRSDDGYLHLRLMPPFNVFHAPMSIPWTGVEVMDGKWGTATLVVGSRRIAVSKKAVEREKRNRELLAGVDREAPPAERV